MAVGSASLLNIDLPMNFDSPYKAISIRDFWKRWHISLTRFFTKYLYIPLGGSRKGTFFTYLNTMIVFLVSGLWHGANWTFLLWGLLHGLLSCCDRAFDKLEERVFMPARWLCTFIVTNILWVLFSAESVTQWMQVLVRIVKMQNTTISQGILSIFQTPELEFALNLTGLMEQASKIRGFYMLLFLFFAFIICLIPENNYRDKNKLSVFLLILSIVSFVWGVLCLGSESVFVYFGF
jgi:alginate O-acetyltransferase complex protein AlgI